MSTAIDYEEIFKMKIMQNHLQSTPVSLVEWKNLFLRENQYNQKEIERAYANVKRELLGPEEEE